MLLLAGWLKASGMPLPRMYVTDEAEAGNGAHVLSRSLGTFPTSSPTWVWRNAVKRFGGSSETLQCKVGFSSFRLEHLFLS